MKRVFLGGTANKSQWREYIKPRLRLEYFDPIVPEWNDEAYIKELFEREHCDFCLYVITPKMIGVYSIAEVIDDSNKRPKRTIFCILDKDGDSSFVKDEWRSLQAVGKMVSINGGKWLQSLDEVIDYLNSFVTSGEHSHSQLP